MIICNSGPLITLSKIGYLYLLQEVFGEVFIPEAVFIEVVEQGAGLPELKKSVTLISSGW